MPEEIGASDAEAEHGLWVGSGLCPQESVVAEVGRYFRVVEVPGQDTHSRWGRAAARALPTMVGTGCRPSVAFPRVGGIGSTPKRAAATGASGPRPVGSSAFRRLDRTPCRAAWTRDFGHGLRRLRGRCAMPPTPRATRPHGVQLRATSGDVSATSGHTRQSG